jgi:hypothetical protein
MAGSCARTRADSKSLGVWQEGRNRLAGSEVWAEKEAIGGITLMVVDEHNSLRWTRFNSQPDAPQTLATPMAV